MKSSSLSPFVLICCLHAIVGNPALAQQPPEPAPRTGPSGVESPQPGRALSLAAQDFPFSAVKLRDGLFRRAMVTDKAYLLRLDPDRLLAGFRREAGLPKKADPYEGWESIPQTAPVDASRTARLKVDLTAAPGTFRAEWFRAHDGVATAGPEVTGGAWGEFAAPWPGQDVVLRLINRRSDQRP